MHKEMIPRKLKTCKQCCEENGDCTGKYLFGHGLCTFHYSMRSKASKSKSGDSTLPKKDRAKKGTTSKLKIDFNSSDEVLESILLHNLKECVITGLDSCFCVGLLLMIRGRYFVF